MANSFRFPLEDRWVETFTNRTTLRAPAQLALMADPTISSNDSRSPAGGNFVTVYGGYFEAHGTPHVGRNDLPHGGNVMYLDGHVDWRNFADMQSRMTGSPKFWW